MASEQARQEFEPYVLDGVVAELLGGPAPAVVGLRVLVEAISVDEHASNGNAFFQAAKSATAKLLSGSGGEYRGNCTQPKSR